MQENNFFFLSIRGIILLGRCDMKKNAFTLIELLAVIVILGIISTIATVSYTRYISKSDNAAYEDGEKTMEAAAESYLTYCSTNPLADGSRCPVIPEKGAAPIEVSLSDLTSLGFMQNIVDPEGTGYCSGKVFIANKNNAAAVNTYDF